MLSRSLSSFTGCATYFCQSWLHFKLALCPKPHTYHLTKPSCFKQPHRAHKHHCKHDSTPSQAPDAQIKKKNKIKGRSTSLPQPTYKAQIISTLTCGTYLSTPPECSLEIVPRCPTLLSLRWLNLAAQNKFKNHSLVLQRHLPVCRPRSSSPCQPCALPLQAYSVSGRLTFSPADISISFLVPQSWRAIHKLLVFTN